jgi:hypothetical protein
MLVVKKASIEPDAYIRLKPHQSAGNYHSDINFKIKKNG